MSDANKQTGPWTVESLPRGVQCGEGSVITGENAFRRYFSQRDTAIVIGDTPRDVEAAHSAGIACVGVASHKFTAEQLHEAGADQVVDSLLELESSRSRAS